MSPTLRRPSAAAAFTATALSSRSRRCFAAGNASPEHTRQFAIDIQRWGIGTAWLTLTDEQYQKLKR